MSALASLGVFAAQTFLILFAIVVVILLIALLAARAQHKSELEVELLHKKYKHFAAILKAHTANKKVLKEEKKKHKALLKKEKPTRKLFVIDFEGDLKASAVEDLREEITAILSIATPEDEVVVRVESPGGVVHGYGLAASQLLRLREKNIPLTVCVDKVAASGGYLMSCTANKILSAPFAIIGSIGVVAQVPNFHRVLKKHDIDYKEYTAGEFKRTVSLFGEVTEKGEEKFKHQLESTHLLFKNFVHRFRPQLDMHQIATGEYWYGEQALGLGLVDEIKTSDDYLVAAADNRQVVKVKHSHKSSISEKFTGFLGKALHQAGSRLLGDLEARRWL